MMDLMSAVMNNTNKNLISIGLITIGNGNWKKYIKMLWDSLEIQETGYRLHKAEQDFQYKLGMDLDELPSTLTNHDLPVQDDKILRLLISMPVMSDYEKNENMVLSPWDDEYYKYKELSRVCSENTVKNFSDYIVILLGEDLTEEEMEYRFKINGLFAENGKRFLEFGNDCECFDFDRLVKWIESEENWCGYRDSKVDRVKSKVVGI